MLHKATSSKLRKRSLDIVNLEDRLLFSVTGVIDPSMVADIAGVDAEVSIQHAPVPDAPNAPAADNLQFSRSMRPVESIGNGAAELAPQPPIDEDRLVGDFNRDGAVNVDDVNMMGKMLQVGQFDSAYDLNRDGAISNLDLDVLIRDVIGTEYGDTNLDGQVDLGDAKTIIGNLFQPGHGWQSGDMNFDGSVDGQDYILWNAHKFGPTRLGIAGSPNGVTPTNPGNVPSIQPNGPTIQPNGPTTVPAAADQLPTVPSVAVQPADDILPPETTPNDNRIDEAIPTGTPQFNLTSAETALAIRSEQTTSSRASSLTVSALSVDDAKDVDYASLESSQEMIIAGSEFHRNTTQRVDVGVMVAKLRRATATRV